MTNAPHLKLVRGAHTAIDIITASSVFIVFCAGLDRTVSLRQASAPLENEIGADGVFEQSSQRPHDPDVFPHYDVFPHWDGVNADACDAAW